MWGLLVGLALAAPPEDLPVGALVIDTSRTARLEVVPRTDPDLVEIVLTDNAKPVDLQLEAQRTEHVREAWAVTAGSGTWFVTLAVTGPTIAVEAGRDEQGRWVLTTEDRARSQLVEPPPPPGVEALLADEVVRRPARPPEVPLTPLLGDAWTARMDARHVQLPVDGWVPEVDGLPEGPATQATIDALRRGLVRTEDPWRRTVLLQRLALTYQELGLHREARHYFDEVARQRTDWPAAMVHLHRADAALATGRWAGALERCREAREAGADDAGTLSCLGGVALATGSPAPTETARALTRVSQDPSARLLAAQLLVLDHRFDEARRLLDALDGLAPDLRRYRDATLGDVLLALGDLEGARGAWRDVGTGGHLGALGRQRARLLRLSGQPPADWAVELPALERDGRRGGIPGAEAHHVAAQIAATYDEAGLAARHLTALVDRWPALTAASDVPQRLLAVCDRRLKALHRADRLADLAGFYHDCWRDELDGLVFDTAAQRAVADGFRRLGLWDDALEAQRDVTAALARDDREEVGPLLGLARLYVQTGRATEALETVAYTARVAGASTEGGPIALVEGIARHADGDLDGALRAWRRAEADPRSQVEARVRRALALAEAGRCDEARPVLEPVADADEVLDEHDVTVPDARLALARCLIDAGDAEAARPLLASLAEREGDWSAQARWLASVASARQPGSPLPDGPLAPSTPWDEVLPALRALEDVEARIEALRE